MTPPLPGLSQRRRHHQALVLRAAQVLSAPGDEPVASPCVSVCRMDPASGYCEGCLRTLDEITRWSALPADGKRALWRALLARAGRTD